jgi:RNA polymerase sigma-70 factor (ECF subfamily)
MAKTVSEAELLARARLGDEDAFTELYRQHLGPVRGMARGILRRNDVEDICQDIFLLAFTRLQGFAENSTFRSWITRIAINQCLVELRARTQVTNGDGRLVQVDDAGALDYHFLGTKDVQLEGVPHRFDLARLLRRLSPQQRRVLTMAYLENVPDLEIAEILGISQSAVKSSIHLAKRRARETYKK